jgi:hypothetical protein
MKHSIIIVLIAAALVGCAQPGIEQESQSPEACRNAVARDVTPDQRVRDIIEKRVALGMTTCDVIAAWGIPDTINEREGYRGTSTTYYWFRDNSARGAVEFLNGRVISIR